MMIEWKTRMGSGKSHDCEAEMDDGLKRRPYKSIKNQGYGTYHSKIVSFPRRKLAFLKEYPVSYAQHFK